MKVSIANIIGPETEIIYPRMMTFIGSDSVGPFIIMEISRRYGFVVYTDNKYHDVGEVDQQWTTNEPDKWEPFKGTLQFD